MVNPCTPLSSGPDISKVSAAVAPLHTPDNCHRRHHTPEAEAAQPVQLIGSLQVAVQPWAAAPRGQIKSRPLQNLHRHCYHCC